MLEAELPADELADSDEYQTLESRIDELRAHNSELLDELDDYEAAFNAVEHSATELGSGDTSQEASF